MPERRIERFGNKPSVVRTQIFPFPEKYIDKMIGWLSRRRDIVEKFDDMSDKRRYFQRQSSSFTAATMMMNERRNLLN